MLNTLTQKNKYIMLGKLEINLCKHILCVRLFKAVKTLLYIYIYTHTYLYICISTKNTE